MVTLTPEQENFVNMMLTPKEREGFDSLMKLGDLPDGTKAIISEDILTSSGETVIFYKGEYVKKSFEGDLVYWVNESKNHFNQSNEFTFWNLVNDDRVSFVTENGEKICGI